ncbi:MAG: hypothetical protein GX620_00005, partial [Chloroflexi bacterium]|nr:hypothetical protein [Chloroflexota bacterium]
MKQRRWTVTGISIIMAIAVLLSSCQVGSKAKQLQAPQPLPPQVVEITPRRGEEHPLDAPVQVLFDQPMDKPSVEKAFTIEPPVQGRIEWPTDRMLIFRPGSQGFARGTRYTVTLEQGARSSKALTLRSPMEYRFNTVGYLEIATVQPASDAAEVATEASVTVLFNRPVVALTAIEDQGNLPQPLTFVPPVRGTGQWLNTSIYLFTPEEGFAPATTYRARVAAGLSDTTGGVLADDYTWEFTTILPAAVGTYPDKGTVYVSPEPTIYVAFNQMMDHASAEAAFELSNATTGQRVTGAFEWRTQGLVLPSQRTYEPYSWSWSQGEGPEQVGVETMGFTPSDPLMYSATYRASLSAGAMSVDGQASTSTPLEWTFTTIDYPRVVTTTPADGSVRAGLSGGLQVKFSSPMDRDSITGNFTISPPVSDTRVFTYWWDNDTQLEISFPTAPNTDYTVTLNGDTQGRYGQRLGEDITIEWATRGLDPQAYLQAPYRVGTYNAYTPTITYVTVRNLSRVNLALYRLPLRDFLRANGSDAWDYWQKYEGSPDNLIRRWSIETDPPPNESRIYRADLAAEPGDTLEPGLYYLEVWADREAVYPEAEPAVMPEHERLALVVTRHNLSLKTTISETLAWATDLESGQPLAGLPIVLMDEYGKALARGTTDADGVYYTDGLGSADRWTPLFAFAGDPSAPGQDFAAAVNQWDDDITPWSFDLPMEGAPGQFAAHIFTERPIYRPGQTVYFKGILREDDDARYSLPAPGSQIHVTIWDAQGTQVFDDEMPINQMGTWNGEFVLSTEAALGNYAINAIYEEEYFGTSFLVAAYRAPEFQVAVQSDRSEYVQGEQINVTAQATYFFGGPVANAQVRYTVLSADTSFNYRGPGRWDFVDYDASRSYSPYGERIAEGTGVTDADGRFTFDIAADISPYPTSQRYTLEVTVTDINNQEVSSRVEAIVHKGLFYIGLRPERYVSQVGRQSVVNVTTVDWQGEPFPNQELTMVFAEHNWYSVQKQSEEGIYYWESSYEDVPVFTTTVTTDRQGLSSAAFIPEKGGVYKAIATGMDERGNEVRSATYLWVSGRDYVSWRQENNDRIELVADKREYNVGDTATVLIPHPYQGPVEALITIERGHIYRHWVQTLRTNSEQIEIPITEDLIPNVYISVLLVKGTDATNPLPGFKLGYVELPIAPTEKELSIALIPDRPTGEHYGPGETVSYDIRVTDSAASPVEAELALSLVDLAVLSLADQPGAGIVNTFWRERGVGVQTASGLTRSGDRVNELVATEAKGLGGGGGAEEFGAVRRDFPDTAYWDAVVRTDVTGRARVSVDLPDNLTTWRLSASGVTADTRVGQAQVDIISSKELLVNPVVPRFFVVGDRAELAAVVHNNTTHSLDVEVELATGGLLIGGPTSQQIAVPASSRVKVTWPVTAEDVPSANLRFATRSTSSLASASGVTTHAPLALSDAIEVSIPIYRNTTPEVVATAGQLEGDGEQLEAVVLPPSVDLTQGELTVQIDPSLAAGMVGGLNFLEHYPYECTEQTVSRFLPNVVAYRALKSLGLATSTQLASDLETRLPQMVGVGLQRLYNQQHYDGGWGWWVSDASDPFLSAYVTLGMLEARRAGFTVDETRVLQAIDFVRRQLQPPRGLEVHWRANRQAFMLYVLAEAYHDGLGESELSRAVSLFDRRAQLDSFGRAYLAMALGQLEPDSRQRVDTLLSDIASAAIVSATGAHWEESQPDYYAMNTDTRSTAVVLAALSRLDPENALTPNIVRWLMAARQDGAWETTQETAWAIIGLTDWMAATGELEGAYDWRVQVNSRELGAGSATVETIDQATRLEIAVADLLANAANRVLFTRTATSGEDGAGRMYYSMALRYYRPVEEVTALNRGIIVSRQYTSGDCDPELGPCSAIDRAQV